MPNLLEIPSSNHTDVTSNERCSRSSSKANKQGIQKLQELKVLVEKAIQNHKTFTVLGPFTCVKNALKLRGWIEKLENRIRTDDPRSDRSQSRDVSPITVEGQDRRYEVPCEDIQISRLLKDYCVDFIWTMKNEPIKWKKLSAKTIVSRFPRAEFTTKAGLCNSLQQSYWYYENETSMIFFPRCFNISNEEELQSFIDNFRLTACISLIKFIHECGTEEKVVFSTEGTVSTSCINFAIQRCKQYVSCQQHEDIDQGEEEKIWDHQWDQFLTQYYSVVHDGSIFVLKEDDKIEEINESCKELMEQLTEYWSQMDLDGISNMWILKPAAKSRGRGILIMKKLEDILAKVGSTHSKDNRFVAQKYIERPMLIYDTKFDIRQWFLVTCAFPLTVWMYKESYLRFCSQLFSLINTHESVHLSNNAVQCKYTNGKRDQNLPDENMWDCYTFKTYLRSKGKPEIWETTIYPGMCRNIICTLLASQETMDHRKNCFELFGADFMLTENCIPWLIEINSGPSMSPSTSVTARMCPQVMDDVIKVVIDRKIDKNADTGMFELVYKQIIPPPQPYMGQNLVVRGIKVENSVRTKTEKKKTSTKPTRGKSSNGIRLEKYSDKLIFVRNRLREKSNYFDFSRYNTRTKSELVNMTRSGNLLNKKKRASDCWQSGIWRNNKENTFDDGQNENVQKNMKISRQLPFVNDIFKQKPQSPSVTKNNATAVLPKIITESKITENNSAST